MVTVRTDAASTPPSDVGGFWSATRRTPDRCAVITAEGTEVSFAELDEQVMACAAGIADLGLQRGDAIAAVTPNVVSHLVVHLAAMRSGWYFTPVNSHLAPPEIAHVIVDSDARAVVVHSTLAREAQAGLDESGLPLAHRIADPMADGYRSLQNLLETGRRLAAPPASAGSVMMYTSGTTGVPKGVRRGLPDGDPDEVLGDAARIYCRGFGMPFDGVHLVCGPLYHAGPSSAAMSALHAGNTLVLMERWDPLGFLAAVQRHGVTSTQMVPTMFRRLLALDHRDRERFDHSSLVSIMHTGAPCPIEVKQAMMDWFGPVVYETYGGTESVATIATPRHWLSKPGTVGKPLRGVRVHILDDDGRELGVGEAGSIYIESPRGRDTEYYKDREKTDRMKRGDLVSLGDIGFLDADGDLFLCDRRVDLIISGGVNIYPAEVEAALSGHRCVGDVAVIGVPDEEWGEMVLAIVEPAADAAGEDELEQLLRDHCQGLLARYKQPRRYEFVETLPRQPNGKIEKRRLRDPYWESSDRRI